MKHIIQLFIFFGLVFLICRHCFFNPAETTATVKEVVSHTDFYSLHDKWVGQNIILQGVVRNSYYIVGIGYYELVDSNGQSIKIFCPQFPHLEGETVEVMVRIRALWKVNNPMTIQVQLKEPTLILPRPQKSRAL